MPRVHGWQTLVAIVVVGSVLFVLLIVSLVQQANG